MLENKISFEVHLTVSNLPVSREAEFKDFCKHMLGKPLLIELSRGEFISQPMFTKVFQSKSLEEILPEINKITQALNKKGFETKRLKIEVPSKFSSLFKKIKGEFRNYYEWHARVIYSDVICLHKTCENHGAHLSLNSLKNKPQEKIITLREFGSKKLFESRVKSLIEKLITENLTILKQEFEYCIYDNNTYLDNGWLHNI